MVMSRNVIYTFSRAVSGCTLQLSSTKSLSLLFLHFIVNALKPLGEDVCCHPSVCVVPVGDAQTLYWIALEGMGHCALSNDEKR